MRDVAETEVPYSLLGAQLAPVQDLLDDEAVSEIAVNRPGEVWIERAGAAVMERRDQPEFSIDRLKILANAVAAASRQEISPARPLLSARLSTGERIQLVFEPVIEHGVAIAIRRQVMQHVTLQQYARDGFFDTVVVADDTALSETDRTLGALLRDGQIEEFLTHAVTTRKNIIVSGGTSSGKTTFANALIGAIPGGERIIGIEDARELAPHHANFLPLIASRGGQNTASETVTARHLLEASLRLRPDRILLGELRGEEAYPYLRAINSGHPGSITTVHSDTPGGALDQIGFMVMQSGIGLGFEAVKTYVRSIIDVIVQLRRIDGQRRIESIWFRPLATTEAPR